MPLKIMRCCRLELFESTIAGCSLKDKSILIRIPIICMQLLKEFLDDMIKIISWYRFLSAWNYLQESIHAMPTFINCHLSYARASRTFKYDLRLRGLDLTSSCDMLMPLHSRTRCSVYLRIAFSKLMAVFCFDNCLSEY